MAMETYTADSKFPFDALVLGNPRPIQGGAHFTQASLGPGRPLYVQLPRCQLKQGIVTTKRACYCDLMYDRSQSEDLISWLLSLEESAQNQIYKRKETWFHTELSKDDIENMLTPMSRLYRSGRNLLIRTHLRVSKETGAPKCTAYTEREESVDISSLDDDARVIPLVLVDGVKFSSRSFEIDVKLVQLMVLDPQPEPTTACLIRRSPPLGLEQNLITSAPRGPSASAADASEADTSAAGPSASASEADTSAANTSASEADEADASASAADASASEADEADASASAADTSAADTSASTSEADEAGTSAAGEAGPSTSAAEEVMIDSDTEEGSDEEENDETIGEIDGLEEIEVSAAPSSECMQLRRPDEVYREIYRAARRKANQMRRAAAAALLEAQQIKAKYLLEDDEDEDENAEEDVNQEYTHTSQYGEDAS